VHLLSVYVHLESIYTLYYVQEWLKPQPLVCNKPVSGAFEVLISITVHGFLYLLLHFELGSWSNICLYIHFSPLKFWYTLQFMNSCINCYNLNVKVDWMFVYLYSLLSLVMCTIHEKLSSYHLLPARYQKYPTKNLCTLPIYILVYTAFFYLIVDTITLLHFL
jgi:hypothetical protein